VTVLPLSDLDATHIARRLDDSRCRIGRPFTIAEITGSTNDDAKQAARGGAAHGSAFLADRQTGGRGRLGRSWYSPAGENLYVSFVLRPRFAKPEDLPTLALAAGLAVADVARAILEPRRSPREPGRVAVKWPNDVYIDGRKVAGVLLEAQSSVDGVVLGIGLNVHGTRFPDEIADRATSLALALGDRGQLHPLSGHLHRGSIFASLCGTLDDRVTQLINAGLSAMHDDLVWLDALAGRSVLVDGEPAEVLGIEANGALRVTFANGRERSLSAGEVTLALPERPKLARSAERG
jgi:BirA family biotin operon repressor/biotin-[acetyl-CoA-carboxylase] ligase